MDNGSEAEDLLGIEDGEANAQALLEREYQIKDLGNPDSLAAAILGFVVKDHFDRAISELRNYEKAKSEFPQFAERTKRYFDHCVQLIDAIRTKKMATKARNLPAAKRQEINERIYAHFHDLKASLQKVTSIELDLKLEDARSTLWVIQAFSISVFVIVVLAVAMEAFQTMRAPISVILNDLIEFLLEAVGL